MRGIEPTYFAGPPRVHHYMRSPDQTRDCRGRGIVKLYEITQVRLRVQLERNAPLARDDRHRNGGVSAARRLCHRRGYVTNDGGKTVHKFTRIDSPQIDLIIHDLVATP